MRQKKSIQYAAETLGILICIFYIFYPFFVKLGWPANHEFTSPFQGTEVYRRAFSLGEWVPTWTPYSQNGFGSPFPLFYHRLFFTISGFIALILGNSYVAVKIAVPLFLFAGTMGFLHFLKKLKINEMLCFVGAFLFLIAPYTFTNWLVRGSMADFSSAMIIPWGLWILASFYEGQRRWMSLSFIIMLLFFGHKIICYYYLIIAAVFFIILIFKKDLTFKEIKEDAKKISLALGFLVVFLLPQVIADFRMMPYFSMYLLKTNQFHPSRNFQPIHLYFAHNSYGWGAQWDGFSVEINRFLLSAMAAFFLLLKALKLKIHRWLTGFSFFIFCFLVFLQTKLAIPFFYDVLPGASFLQHPFRLLSFMTPICIFLWISLSDSFLKSNKVKPVVTWCLVVIVIGLSLWIPSRAMKLKMTWLGQDHVDENIAKIPGIGSFQEYMPNGVSSKILPEGEPLIKRIGCEIEKNKSDTDPVVFDGKELIVKSNVAQDCIVVIRQFRSPILELELHEAELVESSEYNDIRIKVHKGESEITVRKRNLLQLAFSKY